MAFLSKAALLTPSDLKRETVSLGDRGDVRMREMAVNERLSAAKRFGAVDSDDPTQAMLSVLGLVVVSLCNDDDSPMFPTDEEREEAAEALLGLSNADVETLIRECLRINGMDKEATKRAVGNSDASLSDTSSSGSPETSDTPQSAR